MKNIIKLLSLFAIALAIFIFGNNKVQASPYLNGNDYTDMCNRYVKVTKPIGVYKIKTGTCEAKNHFKYVGKIRKGTHLFISHWLMSTGGGWVVINAHKYYSTRRIFFFARHPNGSQKKWYKRID